MSTSRCLITWKLLIGRPKAVRSRAYSRAYSKVAWAPATWPQAAIRRSPWSSHIRSVQPSPSSPSRQSLGSRHSSDTAELLFDDCRLPRDCRLGEEGEGWTDLMWEPGVPFGTTNREK